MRSLRASYVLGFWVAVLLFPSAAQAQDDDDDFTLLRWRGGNVVSDIRVGLNFVGAGFGSSTMGGVISPRIGNGAASLFTNPAGLGLLKNRQLVFNGKIGVGNETLGIDEDTILPPEDIETETDNFLDDLNFDGSTPPIYTNLADVGFRQVGQFGAMSLAFPIHERLVAAIGAHYPLDFTVTTRATGIETLLDAARQSGDQEIDIKFGANVGFFGNVGLRMSTLSLGLGGSLPEGSYGNVSAGFSMNRYSMSALLNVDVQPDALIILSRSTEYYFNDPNDPNLQPGETNQIGLQARGDFRSSEWAPRAGLYYQTPNGRFGLSIVYNALPDFRLEDENAFSESYLPIFINLDGELDPVGDEEDLLNVADIDIAKPNLTKKTSDSLGQVITVDLPSALTIGLDVALGPHTVALNYVQYTGDFAVGLTYDDFYRIGKSATNGVRFGVDLKFPDELKGAAFALIPLRLLFLDIDGLLFQALGKYTKYKDPHYRFGGGVFFGDPIVEGIEDEDTRKTLTDILELPTPNGFGLGREYTIFDNLDIGVMVFSFPDLAFRVGASYNFR